MAKKNPFTLTFGREPNTSISRYEDVSTITDTFNEEFPVSQTMLIEGIRGSGKTVLMTMAANQLKKEEKWVVVNLNPALDLLEGLAARMSDACGRTPGLLNRGFQISAAGFGIGIDGSNRAQDSISIIEECFTLLKKENRRLLITIDEVQPGDNMRIFASQFQIFVREEAPVFLIMTGLYENIYAIQNDPALTFLLRSPKIRTEPLSILQITRQYRNIFDISEEDALHLADLTKGYAFAFQALGVVFWDHRDEGEAAVLEYLDELLDDFVYKKIWASLTRREKDIIRAIEKDGTRTADVCKKTGISPTSFPKYRSGLIAKGILSSEDHGFNTLALPRLNTIVKLYPMNSRT